jgi:uncharacterized repeat protein (TIGR01451 family)
MQVTVPASADVSVTNADSPDPVQVNQNITYTLTARNNGPSTATNVQLTDTLPAGVTFVSATGPRGFGCTGTTTITCPLGSMINGQTITITIVVTVTQSGTVNNTATITSAENDPNPANNSATASTTVSSPTSAVVRITPASASVNPNGSVGQDVQAALSGVTLGNWTINATYDPAVLQVTGCQPQNGSACDTAFAANTVRITGTSAGGLNGTVTLASITFTAIGQGGASSAITPTVVTFTNPSANPITTSTQNGQVSITPPSGVNLALTMTDSPDPVQAGQTLTYSLTVRNNGTSTATNTVVTDTLPAGVTFASASAGSGRGAVSCPHSNGTVSCALGSLAPNASIGITITVNVQSGATGTLNNSATAGSAEADTNSADNTATTSTTIGGGSTPCPRGGCAVDLVLTQTDSPDPVQTGQNLTYTLTVQNTGTAPASNVVVTDTLPGGVTFVSATASQGSCAGTSTVTCNLGSLAGGATATVTIVVQPTANGTLSNTAQVSMTETDPTPANNTATATATVGGSNPPSGVDLALTITDSPDPVRPGQDLTYTLTVRNNGAATATNVALTNTLPGGVTFVSASIPAQRGASCPRSGNMVTCNLGSLAAGASVDALIVVTLPSGASGTLTNNATVGATQADSNSADNAASATTTVDTSVSCPRGGCSADLSISGVDSQDPVQVGESLTYTFTARNHGPTAAADVQFTNALPSGVALVSASSSQGSCAGTSTVICTFGTLANGATAVVTLVVQSSTAQVLLYPAEVSSSTPDPTTGNNGYFVITTITVDPPSPGGESFLSFVSEPGDSIGLGQSASYSPANATFSPQMSADRRQFRLFVTPSGTILPWMLSMAAPAGQQLTVGVYTGTVRWTGQVFSVPSLDFTGQGRGCNTSTGQFEVLEVAYDSSGNLQRFRATFEQHCEGFAPALTGEVLIVITPPVTASGGTAGADDTPSVTHANPPRPRAF